MEREKIVRLVEDWERLTDKVLDLKSFEILEAVSLLGRSYDVLVQYSSDELVPKEVSKILLSMEEFLYFSSMMEEKETAVDFYHYQAMFGIISALREGFFSGKFEHKFTTDGEEKFLTLNAHEDLGRYLHSVKQKNAPHHTGIKLV